MAELTDSVGANGANLIHDVSLVQLMLRLVKNSSGQPYFAQPYTHRASADTSTAISAFQKAKSLGGGAETPGLVTRGGKTWKALAEAFTSADTRYGRARTWTGVPTVYLAMSSQALEEGVNSVSMQANLNSDFKTTLTKFMRECHKVAELAWATVPESGGWRAFEGQKGKSTNAGYGESIHAYGYAVDLTVKNLSWFDGNGEIHLSSISFDGMTEEQKQSFLKPRNKLAGTMGLFGTILPGDFWHLQAFDDDKLDSVSSLMALLHSAGPRKMKWKPVYMTPTNYHCDLGLGGELYFVGTATDIWNRSPSNRISKEDLFKALQAKKKATPGFSVDKFFGRAEQKPARELQQSDIGTPEVEAVQKILKAEFEAAAAHWKDWKPVNYPDKTRRDPNPANPKNKKKK